MNLQKRLASQVMKCSPKRVVFDESKLSEIKEAITKLDVRTLISKGTIKKKHVRGTGQFHVRKAKVQRNKGRRKGQGSRKGSSGARMGEKVTWMANIRAQRALLKKLHEKKLISTTDYHLLYRKAKGGFFRSTRHIKLYSKEKGLFRGK